MQRFIILGLGLCLSLFCICAQASANNQYKGAITAEELEQMVQTQSQGRIVLVNFWATWCSSCRREMTDLAKLRQDYSPEELLILSVSLDSNSKVIPHFLGQFEPNFPIYRNDQGVAQRFEVSTIPKTMIYNNKGLYIKYAGYVPLAMTQKVLEKALAD
jgi:thiol-disulfide isomerase/thioredoxin